MSFAGKRVVVTAAGRGIARRAVERYVEAGARVVASDVDAKALERLRADYPGVVTARADVSDEGEVNVLFDVAARELGGLDILVSAAGIGGVIGPAEDITLEAWHRCLGINLDGAFLCARRAIPMLKAAGRGSIVNFSSMSGLYPNCHRAPYCAAKFAVIGLTKVLAMELGPHRINVNAVCPGPVEGERMDEIVAAEGKARGKAADQMRAEYAKASSMRSFVSADDIVNMVLFVTSEAGRHVSGQALAIDGHTESFAG